VGRFGGGRSLEGEAGAQEEKSDEKKERQNASHGMMTIFVMILFRRVVQ
jgi:hypothetical protein